MFDDSASIDEEFHIEEFMTPVETYEGGMKLIKEKWIGKEF